MIKKSIEENECIFNFGLDKEDNLEPSIQELKTESNNYYSDCYPANSSDDLPF